MHFAGAIQLETPPTLAKGELIFAASQASTEMHNKARSKRQAKQDYPSTMAAMLVERDNAPGEVYFSSSVRGSGVKQLYSGKIDDRATVDSPERRMEEKFGEKKHLYGGSCGEYGALREYDRLNRDPDSSTFKWPDESKTTFVAWFKGKVVPPCGGEKCSEEQFGCAEFLQATGFRNVILDGEPDGSTWSQWKFSQLQPIKDRAPPIKDASAQNAPATDTSCSTTSNSPSSGNSKRSIKAKSCTRPSKAPKAVTKGGKTVNGKQNNVQKNSRPKKIARKRRLTQTRVQRRRLSQTRLCKRRLTQERIRRKRTVQVRACRRRMIETLP